MSQNKKPSYGKKSTPRTGPARVGGQSPNHRGSRSADAASGGPKKARWNASERAARATGRSGERPNWEPQEKRPPGKSGRPAYGNRPQRDDRPQRTERPAYGDRAPRTERPNYDDRAPRTERPSYGDRPQRSERPSYGDRPQRSERPAQGERPRYSADRSERTERTERPAYGDRAPRTERPAYGDRAPRTTGRSGERPNWVPQEKRPTGKGGRPSYGDRPNRGERPKHGDRAPRTDRNERPTYGDRAPRTERPTYGDRTQRNDRPTYSDRPQRSERPSYGDRPERSERPTHGERPTYSADRADRGERPTYGDRAPRTERPTYGDRAPRTERSTHAERSPRGERPYSSDRAGSAERPARRRDFDTRPPRRDFDRAGFQASDRSASKFYPSQDEQSSRGKTDERRPSHGPSEDVVLERLEADAITAAEVEGVSFADLGLGGNIVRQLGEMGAESPFPIQAATIPDVLAGKNVLGRGRTGSGKTIAFGAPMVERLMENSGGKNRKPGRKPRALILAPTRELALQIDRTVQPIARSVGLFTTQIYGGVPQYRQVSALQRGVDIVIGTPGRIEDLIEQGRLDLSEVTVTVLDEADHMCDLGFLEPVQRILGQTADDGQRLMFSATLDKAVAQLVNEYLPNPAVHEVAGEDQASSTIDHEVFLIEHRDKAKVITQLAQGAGKTLIFSRTRSFAEQLADQLEDAGIPATSLHGDLNQARRTRNLSLLTSGRVNVLVATDVAARGIHIDDISLVIQADAPDEYKSYLHRAGRTGRAGKPGTVVTLIPRGRRRRMEELLDRAEITANIREVAPGDAVLGELAAL